MRNPLESLSNEELNKIRKPLKVKSRDNSNKTLFGYGAEQPLSDDIGKKIKAKKSKCNRLLKNVKCKKGHKMRVKSSETSKLCRCGEWWIAKGQ